MYVKLLLPFRMVVVVKYSRELLEILWMEASSPSGRRKCWEVLLLWLSDQKFFR